MTAYYLPDDYLSTAENGKAVNLGDGDTAIMPVGSSAVATGFAGIGLSGAGSNNVYLAGSVVATKNTAMIFTGGGCDVSIAETGSILGHNGLQLYAGGNTVTNDGDIFGEFGGIVASSTQAPGAVNTIVNHGTISGGYALYLLDDTDDQITNTGTLAGICWLGAGDDTLDSSHGTLSGPVWGDRGNDLLIGGDAADNLQGGDDDDVLYGNGGNDRLQGDDGDDALHGGSGQDSAVYTSPVTASLAKPAGNTGEAAGDTYDSIEGLVGSSGVDRLTGNGADNVIDGRGGADVMKGGAGDDLYKVDNAGDQVVEADGGGLDKVYATASFSLGGSFAEMLVLRGSGAINGTGNGLDNHLRGNGGTNRLNGGGGDDVLTGGLGADTFIFKSALSATTNVDTLADFYAPDDTIELDRSVFKALVDLGALSAGQFRAGSTARDSTDHVIYQESTGALSYDADGKGGAAAVLFATLVPGTLLSAADFVVVA